MLHNLSLEGPAFRLRPINDNDADLVIGLRSNPELNRYLHSGPCNLEDQNAWMDQYYKRAGDYYFVIERRINGMPEGLIALYEIDSETKIGEWGRWILKPGSLAAIESAFLIYCMAFERLGLNIIYCRTVGENIKVVSFHDSCGISGCRFLPQHFEINCHRYDAIEHSLDLAGWTIIKPRLEKLAYLTARRIGLG
jgi:RimJ/RimL family protein N-acetyltransferase